MEGKTIFDTSLSRRQLLRRAVKLVSAAYLLLGTACGKPEPAVSPSPEPSPTAALPPTPSPVPAAAATPTVTVRAVDLVVAKGTSPKSLTEAAIENLGGIGRFVKRDDVVVIKPNICVSRRPEFAATTNPEVIETLVRMCLGAGAKTVKVFDNPFAGLNTAYEESGIAAAVARAGGRMDKMSSLKYKVVSAPKGKALKSVGIYDDMLNANVIINVPIAKDHELAVLTLGLKNMMGVITDRGSLHGALGQKVADLATVVRAQLTVVDAVRILVAHGPSGGNLSDVRQTNTIIASADPVAADSYATGLFGKTGNDIDYIRRAAEMGLGEINVGKLGIREVLL